MIIVFNPNVKKDISKLCEKANTNYLFEDLYQEYSKVFLYTNESICKMLELVPQNLHNLNVLGILSGGTFPLECILKGFREIDCIDLNRFSFYFFELLLASFRGLDYEEFLKFWSLTDPYEKQNFLNENIYQKFESFLKKEFQTVWNSFYDFCGGLSQNQSLIIFKTANYKKPSYLSKDVFLKLKNTLLYEELKLRYFSMDLGNLFNEKEIGTYGLIYFSNVLQFYHHNQLASIDFKIDLAHKTFQEKLMQDGIFFVNYLFQNSLLNAKMEAIFKTNMESFFQNFGYNVQIDPNHYWDILVKKYSDIFQIESIPNSEDFVVMARKK